MLSWEEVMREANRLDDERAEWMRKTGVRRILSLSRLYELNAEGCMPDFPSDENVGVNPSRPYSPLLLSKASYIIICFMVIVVMMALVLMGFEYIINTWARSLLARP